MVLLVLLVMLVQLALLVQLVLLVLLMLLTPLLPASAAGHAGHAAAAGAAACEYHLEIGYHFGAKKLLKKHIPSNKAENVMIFGDCWRAQGPKHIQNTLQHRPFGASWAPLGCHLDPSGMIT